MSRAATTLAITGCDVRGKKILVVGAGGIGCELVKNLVLSGFEKILMVDLDTIDYSNLNRQFLFRAKHVGRPKADVARESALEFPHDEGIEITSQHANIKSQAFTLDFFRSFSIVLNALDNVDARRHVNHACLLAGVPLIESGTQGYLGQVYVILKGKTQCYMCDPPAPPKTYPICTIRNHPDKPVHCIAWAKELLFKKLFAGEETDLVDATEAEGAEQEPSERAAAPPPERFQRQEDEDATSYARRVFATVFEVDVKRLLSMETLWKERAKPTAIDLSGLALPDAATLAEVEQRPWSIEECSAVFIETIRFILEERGSEVGSLSFDKDDPQALDFVTAAANLRASIFGIPRLSRWDVKEIAGNIIPAIATTNAIIAGFIVLEAFKVLAGRVDECKYAVCNRHLAGRKRDLLLNNTTLDPPRPDCTVCSGSPRKLTLDTTKWTVQALLETILRQHLSFQSPTIDCETLWGMHDQLCEGAVDEIDEEEAQKYERYLPLALSALPVPITSGTVLDLFDTSQDLSMKIMVEHRALSHEEAPLGFLLSEEAQEEAKEASHAVADAVKSAKRVRTEDDERDPAETAMKMRAKEDDADEIVLLD
ncbi:hypothetical protein AB1Y20_021062 [Prymnesium parvum]|uniref:SUMO-activating enzyme subunit n=1 Tax=Prymnesium parvum TaxID=97485 RepID=A0AB34JJB8_PRYPA